MAIEQGQITLYSDLQNVYTTFNTFITQFGGPITTLVIPSPNSKMQASNINNLDGKITEFKQDTYLSTESAWWVNQTVNRGSIIYPVDWTGINTTISNMSSVKCRNDAYHSFGSNNHGTQINTACNHGTKAHGTQANTACNYGNRGHSTQTNTACNHGARNHSTHSNKKVNNCNPYGSHSNGKNDHGSCTANQWRSHGNNSYNGNSQWVCQYNMYSNGTHSNGNCSAKGTRNHSTQTNTACNHGACTTNGTHSNKSVNNCGSNGTHGNNSTNNCSAHGTHSHNSTNNCTAHTTCKYTTYIDIRNAHTNL